jgi:hypothetical protein
MTMNRELRGLALAILISGAALWAQAPAKPAAKAAAKAPAARPAQKSEAAASPTNAAGSSMAELPSEATVNEFLRRTFG